MAYGFVQSKSATGVGVLSVAATLGSTPTTGNKLIALAFYGGTGGGDFTSVHDANSVNFTQVGDLLGSDNAPCRMGLYAVDVPATPNAVITALISGATVGDMSILVMEYSGCLAGNTIAMVDGGALAPTSHGGTLTYAAPSYTSTAASELLIGGMVDNGGAETYAVANSYVADANSINSNANGNIVMAVKASTNGLEAAPFGTPQTGSACGWVSVLVAFKLAAVAASATPKPVVSNQAVYRAASW